MLKKISLSLFLVLSVASVAWAQSGRRIKNPVLPAPSTPTVVSTGDPSVTASTTGNDDTSDVGYSESASSSARSIYASPSVKENKNKSKNKKDEKKDEKAKTQTIDQSTANQTDVAGDEEVLKVETNLITIPVSVYDRNGMYISNLDQSNFKIFEDGVEQEIAYFGTSDKPFTVVLLIDVSPSTAYKIEEIQQAAIAFVDQLKPQDNVLVVEFDSGVHVLTELTNDRQKIYKAIRRTGFGDGTSLYEAVRFSLRKRLNKIEGRKSIVLFTDGVDTTSGNATFENTLSDAEEADSVIFPIYYNTYMDMTGIGRGGVMSTPPTLGIPGGMGGMGGRGNISAEYARGRTYLEALANTTGGRVFRPESTPGGLVTAFESIAEELRRQYSIGYYSQNEGTAGQRKQIKVRVNRPRLAIRTRDSYIVGGEDQSQSSK